MNDTGPTMAEQVYRPPLTTEAPVRSQAIPRGTCGGQGGIRTGLAPFTSLFPPSVSLHQYSILINLPST
jgi:hypothetical protein